MKASAAAAWAAGSLAAGSAEESALQMGNVQINIESVNPVNPLSHVYQVVGQIIGQGVHRAGIYVDGRLVKRLPVSRGASVSNFHTTFMMNGGTATIRAFSAGNQYVESSIAMPPAVASAPPIVVAPYGMNPYSPFGMNPYPDGSVRTVPLVSRTELHTARAPPTASTSAPTESRATRSVRTERVRTARFRMVLLRSASTRMPRRSIPTATRGR